MATPDVVDDQAWYVNSSASTHVTPEVANLGAKTEYKGKEKLIAGNGSKLVI